MADTIPDVKAGIGLIAIVAARRDRGETDGMATTRLRIGPADHGRGMTLEEFRDAEDGARISYELARGVLEVTEVPTSRTGRSSSTSAGHRRLSAGAPRASIDPLRRGRRVLTCDSRDEVRSPSRPGFVLGDTPLDDRGRGRPSLVAEVVSPRSKAARLPGEAAGIPRVRRPQNTGSSIPHAAGRRCSSAAKQERCGVLGRTGHPGG